MAEGDDLYDDLYEDFGDTSLMHKPPLAIFNENDTREEQFKKKEAELNGKVESLVKEVEVLQQDKSVLTRNISCLFKTAQMELARKDKQMKELRDENSRLKLGINRNPTNNTRPPLTKALPPDTTNVEPHNSEQAIRTRKDPVVDARVSSRIQGSDSEGQRQSSVGWSPGSRGLSKCSNPDDGGGRRVVDESSSKHRSSSSLKNVSSSDRYGEHGQREHGSRDRSRDRGGDRGSDYRDVDFRNSDSRKRHRR